MSLRDDRYTDWDAAYVLGALDAADRREFERHLSECTACSQAVSELAGMPGLLARIPVAEAAGTSDSAADGPSPSVLAGLLRADGVRRTRRRRWMVAVGAAAAAVLGIAVAVGITGIPGAEDSAQAITVQLAPAEDVGLRADVRLSERAWGTAVSTHCHDAGGPSGGGYDHGGTEEYGLYVTDRSGRATMVSSWRAGAASDVAAEGTTELSIEEIALLDIRLVGSDDVLLSGEVPSE